VKEDEEKEDEDDGQGGLNIFFYIIGAILKMIL
jgi:hypothetical protein